MSFLVSFLSVFGFPKKSCLSSVYVQVGVPICHSHAYIDACMHVCASAPPCACQELWCGGWSIRRGVSVYLCARSAPLQCGCVCVCVHASDSPAGVLQAL